MREFVALILVLATLGGAPASYADGQNDARAAVKSGKALPLKRILPQVRKNVPGRILDAQLLAGKRMRYELKVLGAGDVVRIVTVDARSGRILKVR